MFEVSVVEAAACIVACGPDWPWGLVIMEWPASIKRELGGA